MSVYVDESIWEFRGMIMCHMQADTTEELYSMVDAIGVQRKWIQHAGRYTEHFDIAKSKRAKAVRLGAIEISATEMALFDDHRGPQRFHGDGFHKDCPTCGKMTKKITAWSYSRWTDYEKCPQLAKYKHVDRLKEPDNPAMARGSMAHTALSTFVALPFGGDVPEVANKFVSLVEEIRTLDPMLEQEWGFTSQWKPTAWFGNDTWFRSKLDVAIIYDDGTADIVDYKTGQESPAHAQQAELYAISLMIRYRGVTNVAVRFWYLDHGTESVFRFSNKDVDELVAKWTKRVGPMMADTIFAPRPGKHCAFCHWARSKEGPCKFG